MRSSWVMVFALATGACGFQSRGVASGDDQGGGGIDSGMQPPGDTGQLQACHTFSAQTDTCAITFGDALPLSGNLTFNTDDGTLKDDSNIAVAVSHMTITSHAVMIEAIYAHDITLAVGTRLRAIGSKPFALLALTDITLQDNALIDVSAGGAGARTSCKAGGQSDATAGENDSGGAGGGAGGGYGGDGGDGGEGNSDHSIFGGRNSRGGSHGKHITTMPAGPLGGCPGAAGGTGDAPGGVGGTGGGALWLAAGGQIVLGSMAVPAMLNAGGGGGEGGHLNGSNGDGGGGGGGAGGMLWLEAPQIDGPMAIIAANGGGGGEGSSTSHGGNPGGPGALSSTAAGGGTGGADDGADGAAGGSAGTPNGGHQTDVKSGGGGGGGGGVGFIAIASANIGAMATVSPALATP